MRTFSKIETYVGGGPVVVSIGNFDGLHRGHQYLLQTNMDLATKKGARSLVLSFNPHPMQVLKPLEFSPLSDRQDQEQQLEQIGIDDWIIEPFSDRVKGEAPESFIDRLLAVMPLAAIVVGPDFHFGKDRQGDVNFLRQMGQKHHFEVVIPEAYLYHGQRVSSTKIRQLLRRGEVEVVADWLGRFFSIRGTVESGFHRGQKIGFPTANIVTPSAKNLRQGVYGTFVYVRGERWRGATNVGLHPTFGEDTEIKVETHILDFNENLYGEEIRVEFLRFLRPEMKFGSVEALITQIKKDIELVRTT
jgi:riboflavin kinase/FMN adenylyltransferase